MATTDSNVPQTWAGYDADGKEISRYQAYDANNDLNPDEVLEAINNVVDVCQTEMDSFSSSLETIIDQSDSSLRVEGATLHDPIDQIEAAVSSLPGDMESLITPMHTKAIEQHDELQKGYNQAAYQAASSGADHVEQIS